MQWGAPGCAPGQEKDMWGDSGERPVKCGVWSYGRCTLAITVGVSLCGGCTGASGALCMVAPTLLTPQLFQHQTFKSKEQLPPPARLSPFPNLHFLSSTPHLWEVACVAVTPT